MSRNQLNNDKIEAVIQLLFHQEFAENGPKKKQPQDVLNIILKF